MTEQSKRRVGLIGTGGTISSIGRDSLDVWEYMDAGRKIGPDDLVARYPETAQVATIVPIIDPVVCCDLSETCAVRKLGAGVHAACRSYSWMRPPSRSRRTILSSGRGA